jgi:hypothetical protein
MSNTITKQDLKNSILIVIQPDGSHHIRIPDDEELEFNRKAYISMMNTLTVLNEPSYFIQVMLWFERKVQGLSQFIFGK